MSQASSPKPDPARARPVLPFAAPLSSRPAAFVNARLIDPDSLTELPGGVLVQDGRIEAAGPRITAQSFASRDVDVIDCRGDCVSPGLIDMRAFIGEPGAEHRETIASATQAAAAGGITTLVAMPSTNPPIDDPAVVDFLNRRARDTGLVRVLAAAALTHGLGGREIAEIGLLKAAGAIAFTDGNKTLHNAHVMRRALAYARDFDALIMGHLEDRDLHAEGVMNEGELASRLGLPGIPLEAETIPLERDIRLTALTGGRYHACVVTQHQSIAAIRKAKADGLRVTAGTSINHLTLNENDIGDYRSYLKLSPPLRHEDDRQALIAALADGTIDAIVSDHDPQDVETKRLPFAESANGAVGLETMLAAALRLVHSEQISLPRLLRAMTLRPAEILGLPQGRLAPGAPADLIRFDPSEPWIVDKDRLRSRCKNTPFDEARMQGMVKLTMVSGAVVFRI